MLRRVLSVLAVLAVTLVGVACSQGGGPAPTPSAHVAEVVDAVPAKVVDGKTAIRYWLEVSPTDGRTAIYPLHDGNVIYRDEALTSALAYNFSGTATENSSCTPGVNCPASTVHLFSDQTQVTYVSGGICFHNGVQTNLGVDPTCGGAFLHDGCEAEGVFCAPIEMISSFTNALADPVLDLANPGGSPSTPIEGCVNASDNSAGLCFQDSNPKVDPSTSAYVASVPGDGTTTFPCAYCYGNLTRATANGRPGLGDAVVSGTGATLQSINTDGVAMVLSSSAGFGVTATVYFSTPALDPPGTQLSLVDSGFNPITCYDPAATTFVAVTGGGFGPPGECVLGGGGLPNVCNDTVFPATGCCAVGPPGSTSRLTLAGVTLPQTPQDWSDSFVQSAALPTATYGCGVTVQTPSGNVTTADEIVRCGDTWRSFSVNPSLTLKAYPAGGLLGDFVVVAGGRTGTAANSGTNTAQALPLPSCASGSPNVPTAVAALPNNRWGAAGVSSATGVYVIGGTQNGNACTNTILRLQTVGGAWTAMTAMPATRCQATAIDLFDQVTGTEYIVVAGGLTAPNPHTSGAVVPVLATTTLIYNVSLNTWATVSGGDTVLSTLRYNAGGASDNGTSGAEHGIVAGGVIGVTSTSTAVTNVDTVVVTSGTPHFTAGTALPAVRSLPGVALLGGRFYVAGGAADAGAGSVGTSSLFSASSGGGAWTTHATSPQTRQAGILVPAAVNETTFSDLSRLLFVAGTNATLVVQANEFQP